MIQQTILDNGMTVVTEKIDGAHSVVMGLMVKVGSRHENERETGICHFLEHMNFKGTEKRSAKELAQTLELRGGHLNAYTAKEHTNFYCQVVDKDYALAMDVLADLFLNSVFMAGDIEKEKSVVLEEINLYNDSPDDYILDRLSELFWQGHPLARPILGSERSVAAFTREDLLDFRTRHYLPGDTVFAAAGALDHEAIVSEAEKLFANFQGVHSERPLTLPQPQGGEARFQKDISQEHICIGVPGCSMHDRDYFTLLIINEVLGGGPSSRLFQTIREDLAMAYTVFSFHTAYEDDGMLGIYAGTAKGKGEQTMELCCRELEDIATNGLQDNELSDVKQELCGALLIGQDSISTRLNRMARNMMYFRRVISVEEVTEALSSVTNEDILRVASERFVREKLAFAFLGGQD